MSQSITVGCGQGFYGDSLRPAIRALEIGGLDYLCFDALAELTLAILARDRTGNPGLGYARDLPAMLAQLLPLAKRAGTVIITNGGGLNPRAAAEAIVAAARQAAVGPVRVAYVTGDDVLALLDSWAAEGVELTDKESGEAFSKMNGRPIFANVYLGSDPVESALALRPDVVVTGRTTDTAAYLAPAAARLAIAPDDWDRRATAIVVGHLLECGGQATGGNFSGDWWNVPDLHDIGYATAEIFDDGRVVISKPPGTGGRVSRDTLKEQLLYEIHDPSSYITPDVVVDLRDADLEDIGPDRVALTGVRGRPAPDQLKLIAGLPGGWISSGQLAFAWPYALEKAERAGEILRKRMEVENIEPEELLIEYVGVNSLGGPTAPRPPSDLINEVALRAAIRCADQKTAAEFRKLFAPLAINSFPFVGGLRGAVSSGELLKQWSTLVPRSLLDGRVKVEVVSG